MEIKVKDIVKVKKKYKVTGYESLPKGYEGRVCEVIFDSNGDKYATLEYEDKEGCFHLSPVPISSLHLVSSYVNESQLSPHKEDLCVSVTGALRYNKNKLPMHLIPPETDEWLALVLEAGAKKYAERNWEKGANFSVPYSSLKRHMNKFWAGEDLDPETNLPHVYHMLTNCLFLCYYYNKNKDMDDRPYKTTGE
jgi:hypothetical protein